MVFGGQEGHLPASRPAGLRRAGIPPNGMGDLTDAQDGVVGKSGNSGDTLER
jgi:hypothetical protein